MAKDKHPNQDKAAKLHAETGSPGEGISYSPYRTPPYQYDDALAATESEDAETEQYADPAQEIPATGPASSPAGTPGDVIRRG